MHPKGGYYASDLEAVVACYDVGLIFTEADIRLLVKTNTEYMWMKDEKDPKFRKINGTYKAAGKYGKGHLWTALARFSPRVRTLWKAQLDSRRGNWQWPSGALGYLLATSRPVSYRPSNLSDIPKR